MSRLVPLVAVAVLLLAGCTAIPGSDTTPTDTDVAASPDSPSATATTTAEATATIPAGDIAPGVTDEGIDNLTALLAAHESALRDRGFAVTIAQTGTSDGQARSIERETIATAELRRLRQNTTTTVAGNRSTSATWFNETMERMLVRVESGDEVRYRIPPIGPPGGEARDHYLSRFAGTDRLERLLRGVEFNVTGATAADGQRRYLLSGSNTSDDGRFAQRDVELSVTPDGVVRSVSAAGETTDGSAFTFEYRTTRFGVETVERPGWVATAPEPVDSRPTAGFRNCSTPYLTLENPGPDAVPEGSVVTVRLNDTEHEVTLDEALAPDDRRALYLDPAGDLRTAPLDEVPADRTAMPNEAQVTVTTGEGVRLSSGSMGFGCSVATEPASEESSNESSGSDER